MGDPVKNLDTVHMAWNVRACNRDRFAQWVTIRQSVLFVMAGLDPAIHVFLHQAPKT
jgi:hypothetical protein